MSTREQIGQQSDPVMKKFRTLERVSENAADIAAGGSGGGGDSGVLEVAGNALTTITVTIPDQGSLLYTPLISFGNAVGETGTPITGGYWKVNPLTSTSFTVERIDDLGNSLVVQDFEMFWSVFKH